MPPKRQTQLPILPPYARQLLEQPETLLQTLNLLLTALKGTSITDADLAGSLALQENPTAYVISGGVITLAEGVGQNVAHRSAIAVDTEGAAATDDLDTINGGRDGMLLFLRAANDARTIVLKNGTGNIVIVPAGDITLDTNTRVALLTYNSTLGKWMDPAVSDAYLTATGVGAAIAAQISDAVYSAGWDGVTTIAPSKNAVYDKIEAMSVGATDPDAIHDNVAAEISAVAEKVAPVGADLLLIEDSAAGNVKKKVQITNLPGGADADAIHDNVASEISAITEKTAPIAADLLVIEDSAAGNAKKRVQVGNLAGALDGANLVSGAATDNQVLTADGVGGAAWETPPSAAVVDIAFIIDGGGSVITTGIKGFLQIDFACTLNAWTILADQSGSIVIDIWKDTYANFPPTDADTMPGAGKEPTLSAAAKAQDTTITDWSSYTLAAGDILAFNVDSAATVTRVTLSLKATRT